jgi:hypothetical protein
MGEQRAGCNAASALLGGGATPKTPQSGRPLRLLRQGSELGGYEGEESPVEDRGLEPDKCSRSKRASLDSIAASRVDLSDGEVKPKREARWNL